MSNLLPLSSILLSEDKILSTLENGLYMNLNKINCNLTVADIKVKVLEFCKFINSVGRISLLQCDKTDQEEFIFLLLNLKKSIKCTLNELGQSLNKREFDYVCCKCNENIEINPKKNFWSCLQRHEHFEELYCELLNGALDDVTENVQTDPLVDVNINNIPLNEPNMEISEENSSTSIEQFHNEDCELVENGISHLNDINGSPNEENGVNNFRFNFVLHYDRVIGSKIYPENFISVARKIDKIKEYTIQKAGPNRAVCLLCSCELLSMSKMSVMDHCMGQRHLRYACNPVNLSALKKYHETWLNMETNYQAHQVYFKPEGGSDYKCVLCNSYIIQKNVQLHIETTLHKKKVLDLYERKSNIFYLIDLQIQIYGIILESTEVKAKVVKRKELIKEVTKRSEKTDSDSSPSSDSKEPKHNIIKSVENLASANVLDLVPNRFREHLKYLKNNGNVINCELCRITLAKDIDVIKKHIKLATHAKASDVPIKKYNFFCEICNIKISDEHSWQQHFTDGPNRHASMAEGRKKIVAEYECTKCCTVIYGDELSLTRHLSINSRRERKTKEVKLPEHIKKMFRTKEIIELEGQKLTNEASNTLKYNQLTMECCRRLEITLNTEFNGCKAYPFGSRISGVGNKYSDLDVFIDIGDMYTGYKYQDSLAQVRLVRKAAGILSKHKDEFQDVFQIPTARTPIVKLFHKTTEIECDLSFRHGLSVENTKFLRFCLDLQPITQPFIMLLKKWSEHNNLTEHITTYAFAIMAIFFLQVNNYLLSVKRIRELNPKESLVINGWETINYTMPLEQMKKYITPYPHNVTRLLRDFFGFAAKFSYANDVVCPLLGHVVKKKQFYENPQEGSLPVEMNSYIAQLQSEEPEHFRAMSPFCIQDPFDLSHNLTKACQAGTVNKFITLCDLTFKHIDSLK